MPSTLVKANVSQAIGQSLIDDLYLQKSKYYYTLGKAYAWPNADEPPSVIDTEKYEQSSREDVLYFKRIEGTALSFVIPRIDYTPTVIYDVYDDNISLIDKQFYVLNSDFNVYKCLHNNGGRPSSVEPFGTSTNAVSYDDGYVWKFIYTIPPALRSKFLTSEVMPVYNSITERYYSRGSINSVIINSGGSGYASTGTTINVTGDGFLEFDPYKITTFLINNPGSGYSTAPSVKTQDIFENNTNFIPSSSVIQGQVIKVIDAAGVRYYRVESAGVTDSVAPNHYYVVSNNGSASLRHIGTEPKITATVSPQIVGSVAITDPGFGYLVPPVVTKDSPGSGCTLTSEISGGVLTKINVTNGGSGYTNSNVTIDKPFADSVSWTPNTIVDLNDILQEGQYFYLVTAAGQTGVSAPTHTSGSLANGTTVLSVVGKQAVAQSVNGIVATVTGYSDVNLVKVLNQGSGYTTASVNFVGGNPTSPAVANAIVTGGKVVRVVVTYPGYGYESAPTATIVGDGTGATLEVDIQFGYGYRERPLLEFSPPNDVLGNTAGGDTIVEKTNAIIDAVVIDGVVRGINIIDAGVGYTSARLTVLGTGTGASLSALFASGDLTTIQAQSELFAVPGTVSGIAVENQGSNLQYVQLALDGDGTGVELEPVLLDGKLDQVKVINPGSGYTYLNITLTINPTGTAPVIRAILSPIKGHGSNPVKEFYTRSVALNGTFAGELNNGFEVDNEFRQVMIYKNPLAYNTSKLLEAKTASACLVITPVDTGFLIQDNIIMTDSTDGNQYRVISHNDDQILLEYLSEITLEVGTALAYTINNINYTLIVKDITLPQVDKYSGEILFIDNLKPFSPNDNQAVTITTAINLL